jgi:hypothetical protein
MFFQAQGQSNITQTLKTDEENNSVISLINDHCVVSSGHIGKHGKYTSK